ncbi:hypothetical protein B0H12DRAFT_1077882 [Mycena haematopus]|nr:hypothetical protein B0H12DRAFT_1077882 [Mycena haematopus]
MNGRQQKFEFSPHSTTFSSRISAAVRAIIKRRAVNAEGESNPGTQYDSETESIASTLVGRGGAGNFRAYSGPISSQVGNIPRSTLVSPVMRSTGRGGAGNIKPYSARDQSPSRGQRSGNPPNNGPAGYCGRGGVRRVQPGS